MPQYGSNQGGGNGWNRDSLRFTTPSQPEQRPAAQPPQESEYGFNGEPLSLPRARSASGTVRRTRTDNSIEFPTQARQLHTEEAAPSRRRSGAGSTAAGRTASQRPRTAQSGTKRRAAPQSGPKRGTAAARQHPQGQKQRPQNAAPRDPRRKEQRKKRKVTRAVMRRRRMMRRLAAFAVLLVVIGVGFYLTLTMLFRINSIQVQTADGAQVQEIAGYTSDQILQALGVQNEDNIFSFDPKSKAAALERQFPLLESIQVERDYPNAVVVRVTEATAVYAMQTTSGWLTLSDHFKILACDAAQPAGLCTLYGGDPVSVQPGDQLNFEAPQPESAAASEDASEASSAAEEVPEDNRLDTLETLRSKLEEYGLLADVTRMEFADTDNVAFLYQDRISVLLGTLNDLDAKIKYVSYIVNNEDGKGCAPTDTGKLDLSHVSASNVPKFYLAQGEPTLPSGYVVPAAVEEPAASEPAEDTADSDSTAAPADAPASAEDEVPLTDPARMTAVDDENPM